MKHLQACSFTEVLAPVTAATTARTAALDCQGVKNATIVVHIGAEANTNSTNVAINLSESDDGAATSATTFDANFSRTVDNTSATVAVDHVDMRGRKRYLHLTITPDTTTNGAVITDAVAILDKEVRDVTASSADDVVVG